MNYLLSSGLVVCTVDQVSGIDCYACGLPMLDPTLENEKYSWDPYDRGTKMYNESCTQYKQYQQEYPQFMDKWLRKCPAGVTTCFWAKGIRWRKPEDDKDDVGKEQSQCCQIISLLKSKLTGNTV